jgi:hypothetical protein
MRVGELPAQLPAKPAPCVLAVGETSGHWHEVEGVVLVKDTDAPNGRGRVIVTGGSVRVGGQPWRHDPLPLTSGEYEYWVGREWAHGQSARVTD